MPFPVTATAREEALVTTRAHLLKATMHFHSPVRTKTKAIRDWQAMLKVHPDATFNQEAEGSGN